MIVSGSIVLKAERGSIYLWTNQDPVVVTSDNVQRTPLLVKVKQGEGAGRNYEAWLTIRVENVSGSTATTLYEYKSSKTENGREYVLPQDKYATANRITVLAHDDAARTTLLDEMRVGIVAESPIPFPCPETEWKAEHTFRNGEYLMTSDAVYMWVSRVPGNTPVSPKEYGDTSPRVWTKYQKWPLLATAILLADFAKLGSAVFHGQYMFSQQGTDADGNPTNAYHNFGTADFTPNLMFDFLRGRGTFSGFIKKVKTVINQDNFYDYFEYVEQWGGYAPYADRLASYIELTWIPAKTIIALPRIFPARILWSNDLIQNARANIGNVFILLNHSGVDVTVSGCTTSSDVLPFDVTVKNGHVLHAECTAMINTSTEYIAWTYIEAVALG